MPPLPTFASCGHRPPPLPAIPSPSSTPTSLSGYCRPCDFTRTRRTILRISEHYEEQIADLEQRIDKAKLELFRSWNEYLAERKDMAVKTVERLKGTMGEECEGAWREFDERWGGRAVAGGS